MTGLDVAAVWRETDLPKLRSAQTEAEAELARLAPQLAAAALAVAETSAVYQQALRERDDRARPPDQPWGRDLAGGIRQLLAGTSEVDLASQREAARGAVGLAEAAHHDALVALHDVSQRTSELRGLQRTLQERILHLEEQEAALARTPDQHRQVIRQAEQDLAAAEQEVVRTQQAYDDLTAQRRAAGAAVAAARSQRDAARATLHTRQQQAQHPAASSPAGAPAVLAGIRARLLGTTPA
jgi:hypothetical protein